MSALACAGCSDSNAQHPDGMGGTSATTTGTSSAMGGTSATSTSSSMGGASTTTTGTSSAVGGASGLGNTGGTAGDVSAPAPEGGAGGTAEEPDANLGPTYIKASNTDADDGFGVSVVLSADGQTLAVGADGEDSAATGIDGAQDDNSLEDSGAVYVFVRAEDAWQQEAYIKASNSGASDGFGGTLAMSDDGNTLVISAPAEDGAATGIDGDQQDDSAEDAGAVYVFVRGAAGWQQQAYIKASNAGASALFGIALALSADGNTLAVGAEAENSAATGIDGDQQNTSAYASGAVYVFSRTADSWQQQAYVKASNTDGFDRFGHSVALSSDGAQLAVGAYREDSTATGIAGDETDNSASDFGAVYVFSNESGGWEQQAYIKPAEYSGAENIGFGISLSLSAAGDLLAVGAAGEASAAVGIDGNANDTSSPYTGAVYMFAKNGAAWTQDAYLKASNADAGDEFGQHLHLAGGGQILAVGAAKEASGSTGIDAEQNSNSVPEAGAVYIFGKDSAWGQRSYLKTPTVSPGARFGWAISSSSNGEVLAVSAVDESGGGVGISDGPDGSSVAQSSGAVYVYDAALTADWQPPPR